MPVFNGEQYLAEAIESILAQSFADFELLIVDDGSTDASAEIITDYQSRDSRIRFFPLTRNVGRGDARNIGFFAAKGEFVTSMDCDDISLPERLEKQVAFMESNPCVGAVGGSYRVIYPEQERDPWLQVMPAEHALIVFCMYIQLTLCGALEMYRRDMLHAVGGNTPGTREADDHLLQLRLLWQKNITFANLPDVLYVYRVDDSSLSVIDAQKGYPRRQALYRAMLERLLGAGQDTTCESLDPIYFPRKTSWSERRAARRALRRIAAALIAVEQVDANDRPLLMNVIDRRLEESSPRRWQQFCHWRRQHFQR